MLQVFFGPEEPGFAAVSGALIAGSFFDGSAGLAFSMAAALVVRSLKDMRFILFGVFRWNFRASIRLEFSNAAYLYMCIDWPLYYARCLISRRDMAFTTPRANIWTSYQSQDGVGLAVLGNSVHPLLAMNNLGDIRGAHRPHERAVVQAHLHLGPYGTEVFGSVDNGKVARRTDERKS